MDRSELATAIAEAAKDRRSYRDYAGSPVEAREVAEVLALAARAPSAWNLQPWRFVVVTDPETKEALKAAAYHQKQVAAAPVVVALYSDMVEALARVDEAIHPSFPPEAREATRKGIAGFFGQLSAEGRDQWGKAQANIALGYLLLLLEANGYASSPMLGFDAPSVRKVLGLPDHAQVPALIAIGRPAPDHPGPQHRLPPSEIIRFVESPSGVADR